MADDNNKPETSAGNRSETRLRRRGRRTQGSRVHKTRGKGFIVGGQSLSVSPAGA